MSCCCCTPESAGITLGGILLAAGVAFVVINMAAILHFLLMVLLGTLTVGTAITAVGALVAWRMHAITPAPTVRYHVEQVPDGRVLEGEVIEEAVSGRVRKALEASSARGIPFGVGELSNGTLVWADGSPVRPIRHSQR